MSPLEHLDPIVQHHIVNTLGWRELRELQELSIEPILEGNHCLVLAPTAGGKTEAAVLPILSRICSENWPALSTLYICPLKALLNNLGTRLERYAGMVGRRSAVWHGDIAASAKTKLRRDPPDILLTTPESLEVMLTSKNSIGREMLRTIRVAVIDEIHAFAGDDRGWHLLAVLERVTRLAEGEIQRVGLSATVGNPDQLLEWLAGHCAGPRTVTKPTDPGRAAADIVIDYVGSLDNAAVVISRLHRGEKRLVFCDSRSQVEELAGRLRTNGIQTYVSHSSLSFEERRSAEQAFAEGSDCVIVSTSTLELGIDVGDLDRVIQVDAPNTVASFLQRLGRTGRRPGTQRNCLFLATTPEALLRAGALYDLWQSGYVEPIEPPAQPLHILGQQLMALCLQLQGLGLRDWPAWIGRLPPFAELGEVRFQEILNHLIQQNILHSDGPWLSLGDRAQEEYGRRNFLELVSVFTTAPLMKLLHGRKELGTVDDLAVLKSSDSAETILSLGGRSWRVLQIDWRTREVFVEPVEMAGRTRWIGMRRGLSFPVAQAVRRLLIAYTEPASWSSRTREQMNVARSDYAFLRPGATVVVDDQENSQYAWYTFAGGVINLSILQALTARGFEPVTSDDFSLRLSNLGSHLDLPASIHSLNADAVIQGFAPPSQYIRALKFNDCLPEKLVAEILRSRMLCRESIEAVLQEPVVIVTAGNGASPSVRMAP